MGGKRKKGYDSYQGSQRDAARQAKPDMSKYAGATSNKSKRNYADLRLARPENLKEYASENARPRGSSGQADDGQRSLPSSVRPSRTPSVKSAKTAKSRGAKKPKSVPSASAGKRADVKRTKGRQGKKRVGGTMETVSSWVEEFAETAAKGLTRKPPAGNGKKKKKRPPSVPAPSGPPKPEYTEDAYSRALAGEDFYSSVYQLYDIKHPERQKGARTQPVGRSAPKPDMIRRRGKKKKETAAVKTGGSSQSVAAFAVKNRGTDVKKKHAQVMKTGKAKGVVTSKVAHRRVHRRNRRTTMVFNAVMVMIVIVFLAAVYVNVFFNVKDIVVKGESPYAASRISSMCGFQKGDNILFIDAQSSEEKIVDRLPYIESCTIRRRLPATVVVNVTDAKIAGVADTGVNQWVILSCSGKVLETVTNMTMVSASDAMPSLTYAPEYASAADVAAARNIPVLQGLDIRHHMTGTHLDDASAACVSDFGKIIDKAASLGMSFTTLKYGERGYEAEYEHRINIVLGKMTEEAVISRRLEVVHYIILESGQYTEHDRGEFTFYKNETYFNPEYEISEEAAAQNGTTDAKQWLSAAEKLLRRSVKNMTEQEKKAAASRNGDSATSSDGPSAAVSNPTEPVSSETVMSEVSSEGSSDVQPGEGADRL